ncbi:hypothetical protein MRB53_020393 [Persea americana]|uniref:Uncharacterized protein n=1 Tax=Persea americana TaxID=3435 RepID=A0ACC2L0N0_PERAE|nr:hypothetical protein MRB53_020393 [Persea americana]
MAAAHHSTAQRLRGLDGSGTAQHNYGEGLMAAAAARHSTAMATGKGLMAAAQPSTEMGGFDAAQAQLSDGEPRRRSICFVSVDPIATQGDFTKQSRTGTERY